MHIAVVGAGGVGGYFGGRLAAAGARVTFIARGAHLEAMTRNGLTVKSPRGDLHLPSVEATNDPAAVGPVDIVMFAVKLYDMEQTATRIGPLIGPDTVVIPFQNGVDAVGLLTRVVGPAHVAGGVAYVSAVIDQPGVIRHTALDKLIFGEIDGTRSGRLERFLAACEPAGFQAVLSQDIKADLWSKFVRISTWSGLTTVTRTPIGVIRDDQDLFGLFQAAIFEGMAVARASGVTLPPTVFDEVMAMVAAMPYGAKASMLEDLERGKPLELPWLSGAIVRIARELDVPTPTHRFIAAVLKPYVSGALQS